MSHTQRIRVGIGGWTFEPWRDNFYPAGLPHSKELHHASRQLTSIEVNGTYYSSFGPSTFAKWRDETPDGFVFSLKANRFATNRRVLAEAGSSIERFLTSGITELKNKLGPLNWQFMGTKKFDPDDFEAFLKLLPKSHDGRKLMHAVEVRHDSFKSPDFIALAKEYGVAVILGADSDYPLIPDITGPFVYARIMGTQEGEKLGYPKKALDLWASRAAEWAAGGAPKDLGYVTPPKPAKTPRDVFLYVISGHKVLNPAAAMAIIERLT